MALIKSINTPHGLSVSGAYHRVSSVHWAPPAAPAVEVVAYADEAARRSSKAPLASAWHVLTDVVARTGESPLGAIYRALKVLPEYAGAEDVFESGQPGL